MRRYNCSSDTVMVLYTTLYQWLLYNYNMNGAVT